MTRYTEKWSVEVCIHGNWIIETRLYHCPKFITDSDLKNIPGKRRNAYMIETNNSNTLPLITEEIDPYNHFMNRHTDIY